MRARLSLHRSFDDGGVALVWRLRALDADGAPVVAGPAGWAELELTDDITIVVDYLDPTCLISADVHAGVVDDLDDLDEPDADLPPPQLEARTAQIVAALFGDPLVAALRTPIDGEALVDVDPSNALSAAGRLALLSTFVGRTRRTTSSLWATEAAQLVEQIDPSMHEQATNLARTGAHALETLPPESVRDVFRGSRAALGALVSVSERLAPEHTPRALADALAAAQRTDEAPAATPVPRDWLVYDVPSIPISTGVGAAVVYRGEPSPSVGGAAPIDPHDEHRRLLSRPCEYRDDGEQVEVVMYLSATASLLPPDFLSRLRAVARDAHGRVMDRSAFDVEGDRATATLRRITFADASDVWFDVTSASRASLVAQTTRLIESAVAVGQRAADVERAALALPETARASLATAAESIWYDAATRWDDAGKRDQARAAAERADRCSQLEFDATEPFAVERLTPALAYWLGDIDPGDAPDTTLVELSALARAVDANSERVTFDLELLRRDEPTAPTAPVDVDEMLWAALASGESTTVQRAARAWTEIQDAREDLDDDN